MAERRVFLSYRRHDTAAIVGRLSDHLLEVLGPDAVFKDVDSIAPGQDFRAALRASIEQYDAMLVVIGPRWLDAQPGASTPRLFEEGDFVRAEIEQGIASGAVLIPVLVDGASMPTPARLPPTVQELAYRQAAPLRADPDFHTDLSRLLARPPFGLDVDLDARRLRPGRMSPRTAGVVGGAAALLVAVLVVALARGGGSRRDAATTIATAAASVPTSSAPPAPGPLRDDRLARLASLIDPTAVAVPADVIEVLAQSTLAPQGSTTYDARNLVDRDLDTAWTEGAEGLGVGTRIVFRFSVPMAFHWVEIWPGWQSAFPCRFEKNARPTELTAYAVASDGTPQTATAGPLDATDPRSRIVLTLSDATYTDVTLTITGAAPGERCTDGPFDDTAISEVRFFATNPCPDVLAGGSELPVPASYDPNAPVSLPASC